LRVLQITQTTARGVADFALPGGRLRWTTLLPALLLICLSTAGAAEAADPAYDRDRAMFADGYAYIDQHYIRKIDLGPMVASGLAALGRLDPSLSARIEAGRLVLLYGGAPADSFALAGQVRPDDWAALTARALQTARGLSPAIRAADSERVYAATFDALLAGLDPPFSRYAGRDQAAQNLATRQGFAGVGVHVATGDGAARIASIIPDTPAERAGLHAGDIIAAVDGTSTQGLDQQTVVGMLRGAEGSSVTLAIRRWNGGQATSITITRSHVAPQTVKLEREGSVAYLRVYQFGEGTAAAVRQAIEGVAGLSGIVLDLRDDPGGLLKEGVALADLFMTGGRIVAIRGRDPGEDEVYDATTGDLARGLPIAILINAGSASAAEIVAAALQDSGRAVAIGSNSYGKGTIQAVHRMPNGGELTLTVARYYAPSGYTLNHLGVLPAICTTRSAADAASVLADLGAGRLPAVPVTRRAAVSPDDTAGLDSLRATCPGVRADNPGDLDLALRLLAEPGLYVRAIALSGARVSP
jgi:carboxyl-terminal processing protease